jgi:septum formation protein
LSGLDISFITDAVDMDESFPDNMLPSEVAQWLAERKSQYYTNTPDGYWLLTCDTVVVIEGEILNKPLSIEEAVKMLRKLSGNMHEVYTGVCLRKGEEQHAFTASTKVYMKEFSEEEISYYIEKYQPMDKAGAYGIQEWLGYSGIYKIEGCYYNVMGLPLQRLYETLKGLTAD